MRKTQVNKGLSERNVEKEQKQEKESLPISLRQCVLGVALGDEG
jgi:hypothetical protein